MILIVLVDFILNSFFSGGFLIVESYFCAKSYKDRLDLLDALLMIFFLIGWNRLYYYQLLALLLFLFALNNSQKSFILDSYKSRYLKILLFFNLYMIFMFTNINLESSIYLIFMNNIILFFLVKLKDYAYPEKKDIVIFTRN